MHENFRTYGRAPFHVAVIHGGPGAAGEMAPVARRLSEECGVLEPLQSAVSLEGQIEELREVLLHHATPPAVLIGHSWGAWLSLLVASRYPALVRKLILISCSALEERYTAGLHSTRLARLDPQDRAAFEDVITALQNGATGGQDALLARLGALASKADTYARVEDPQDDVQTDGEIYRQVWKEAAEMRGSGELLRCAQQVACPIVAVHGDSDPSPAAGVVEPLNSGDFRLVVLRNCGHTPWLELYAHEEFYRLLRAEIM